MLAFAAACAPATAAAADAVVPPRAITAAGTAEVRVAPDVAQVLVGVVTAAPRAADAVDANSRIVDKVLVALGEFSIAERDLQTVGFRVEPEFSQPPRNADPNWTPAIVGFRVHNQVQVRTRDLVRAGEMLAAAAAAGANQIGGITFTLSDAKPHERRAQAEATRDALAQVAAIADAAGVRTGRILALNAAGGGIEPVYREYARGAMMMAADAVAPVPVQAGEVVIRASVTASVAIAD
jgi:hypothetical protein